MTDRPTITPTLDMPMSVAVEELTGYEVLAIEKRYRATLSEMGAVSLMIGTVWAYLSRDQPKPVSWTVPEGMTIAALTGFFAPEPQDTVSDEPDSDLGKES